MRRGLLVVLSLALLSASIFGLIGTTKAHPVTINTDTTEWTAFGVGPSSNIGHIIRNSQGQGEFAWTDEEYDHRVVTSTNTFTREVDLRRVRVTGDPQNLSVYMRFAGTTRIEPALPGADLPQLQIAIDTGSGGKTTFVSPATPTTTLTVGWEYLLKTQFNSGVVSLDRNVNTAPVRVYSSTGAPNGFESGSAALQRVDNTLELQVPWSALGLSGPPSTPLRFTVIALRSSGVVPTADANGTNILDTISPSTNSNAGPKGADNTLAELADGDIDYWFEVPFENGTPVSSPAVGEVYSPLLVTEVGLYPRATGGGPNGDSNIQWIEITNVSGAPISGPNLTNYKIGDVPQRISNEGMFKLPNVPLNPGQSIIVTRDKAKFGVVYPNVSQASVYAVSGLTQATNWASGTSLSLRTDRLITETSSLSDQIVLLDSTDSIADFVEYTNIPLISPYPDHTPVTVPVSTAGALYVLPVDLSIQRCASTLDTNNRGVNRLGAPHPDWLVLNNIADQTPLGPCLITDMGVTATGPQTVVVNAATPVDQNYTINFTNSRSDGVGVRVTNLLPAGMSYKANSTTGSPVGVGEPIVTPVGDRVQLEWNLGTVPAATIGQINFTATVAAGTPEGSSAHELSISSTSQEVQADQGDNTFVLPVTYSDEPVADVTVVKSIVSEGATATRPYSGGRVVYRVTYTNNGGKDASTVTLEDTIPAGLIYISNSQNFTADTSAAGKVTLTVPQVLTANGGSGTVDMLFAIDEGQTAGSVIAPNSITIKTVTTPEVATNNTATSPSLTLVEQPPVADLQVQVAVKDASNATPGGTIVYTVNYANIGEEDAFGVTLTSAFPPNLVYASNSGNLTPVESLAGRVKFALPTLLSNSSGTVDLTFTIKPEAGVGTRVSTLVTIDTESEEAPITNNTAASPETTIKNNTPVETTYKLHLPIVKK